MAVDTDTASWHVAREALRRGTGSQGNVTSALATMTTSIDAVIGQSAQAVYRTADLALHQASHCALADRADDEATIQALVRVRAVNAGQKSPG